MRVTTPSTWCAVVRTLTPMFFCATVTLVLCRNAALPLVLSSCALLGPHLTEALIASCHVSGVHGGESSGTADSALSRSGSLRTSQRDGTSQPQRTVHDDEVAVVAAMIDGWNTARASLQHALCDATIHAVRLLSRFTTDEGNGLNIVLSRTWQHCKSSWAVSAQWTGVLKKALQVLLACMAQGDRSTGTALELDAACAKLLLTELLFDEFVMDLKLPGKSAFSATPSDLYAVQKNEELEGAMHALLGDPAVIAMEFVLRGAVAQAPQQPSPATSSIAAPSAAPAEQCDSVNQVVLLSEPALAFLRGITELQSTAGCPSLFRAVIGAVGARVSWLLARYTFVVAGDSGESERHLALCRRAVDSVAPPFAIDEKLVHLSIDAALDTHAVSSRHSQMDRKQKVRAVFCPQTYLRSPCCYCLLYGSLPALQADTSKQTYSQLLERMHGKYRQFSPVFTAEVSAEFSELARAVVDGSSHLFGERGVDRLGLALHMLTEWYQGLTGRPLTRTAVEAYTAPPASRDPVFAFGMSNLRLCVGNTLSLPGRDAGASCDDPKLAELCRVFPGGVGVELPWFVASFPDRDSQRTAGRLDIGRFSPANLRDWFSVVSGSLFGAGAWVDRVLWCTTILEDVLVLTSAVMAACNVEGAGPSGSPLARSLSRAAVLGALRARIPGFDDDAVQLPSVCQGLQTLCTDALTYVSGHLTSAIDFYVLSCRGQEEAPHLPTVLDQCSRALRRAACIASQLNAVPALLSTLCSAVLLGIPGVVMGVSCSALSRDARKLDVDSSLLSVSSHRERFNALVSSYCSVADTVLIPQTTVDIVVHAVAGFLRAVASVLLSEGTGDSRSSLSGYGLPSYLVKQACGTPATVSTSASSAEFPSAFVEQLAAFRSQEFAPAPCACRASALAAHVVFRAELWAVVANLRNVRDADGAAAYPSAASRFLAIETMLLSYRLSGKTLWSSPGCDVHRSPRHVNAHLATFIADMQAVWFLPIALDKFSKCVLTCGGMHGTAHVLCARACSRVALQLCPVVAQGGVGIVIGRGMASQAA